MSNDQTPLRKTLRQSAQTLGISEDTKGFKIIGELADAVDGKIIQKALISINQ